MMFLILIHIFLVVLETGGMFSNNSLETNLDSDTFLLSPVEFNTPISRNIVQNVDRWEHEYMKLKRSSNLTESLSSLIHTTNGKTTKSFMLPRRNRSRRSRTLFTKYSDFTSQFGSSLEMIIATQMLNCPSSAMCTTNQNAVLKSSSCCESSCSCAADCRTLNVCCPDADIVGTPSEPRFILKCVQATYLTRIRNMDLAYKMVTYCSNHSNAQWVKRCALQDKTYLLLVMKIPVSSLSYNGTVFQNKYCAWCNGQFDTIEWKTKIVCTEINPRVQTIVNLKLLDEEISGTDSTCDLEYMKPTNTTTIKCTDKQEFNIHTCNVTGKWDTHDPWIETACRSYYSPYVSGIIYYRNVFCCICNIKESAGLSLLPDISNNLIYSVLCLKHDEEIRVSGNVFSAVLNFDFDNQLADEVPTSSCKPLPYNGTQTVGIHLLIMSLLSYFPM